MLNKKLLNVLGDDVRQEQVLAHAHNVLNIAVGGKHTPQQRQHPFPRPLNVRFGDVSTVMSKPGKATVGTATDDAHMNTPRVWRSARRQAADKPLPGGVEHDSFLVGARRALWQHGGCGSFTNASAEGHGPDEPCPRPRASSWCLELMHPRFKRLLSACALLSLPFLAVNGLTVLGYGPWSTTGLDLLLLPVLAALVALPVALLVSGVRRHRAAALDVAATSVGLIVGGMGGAMAGQALRMHAFELAAQRAAPLVAAVKAYERDHGEPPRALDALVPAHLPGLPDKLPPMKIVTDAAVMTRLGNSRWALVSRVSSGFVNWDLFLYLPSQDYPEAGYGGRLQRVGDWAYVHE